jgi:hypothetical protein
MTVLIILFAFSRAYSQGVETKRFSNYQDSTLYILSHSYTCNPLAIIWAQGLIDSGQINDVMVIVPSTYEDSLEKKVFQGFGTALSGVNINTISNNELYSYLFNLGLYGFVKIDHKFKLFKHEAINGGSSGKIELQTQGITILNCNTIKYRESDFIFPQAIQIGNSNYIFSANSNLVNKYDFEYDKTIDINMTPLLNMISDSIYKRYNIFNSSYLMKLRDSFIRNVNVTNNKEFQLANYSVSKNEVLLHYTCQLIISEKGNIIKKNRSVILSLDSNLKLCGWWCKYYYDNIDFSGIARIMESPGVAITSWMPAQYDQKAKMFYPFARAELGANGVVLTKDLTKFSLDEVESHSLDFSYMSNMQAIYFAGKTYYYCQSLPYFIDLNKRRKILLPHNKFPISMIQKVFVDEESMNVTVISTSNYGEKLVIQILDEGFRLKNEYVIDLKKDINGIMAFNLFKKVGSKMECLVYPFQFPMNTVSASKNIYRMKIDLSLL